HGTLGRDSSSFGRDLFDLGEEDPSVWARNRIAVQIHEAHYSICPAPLPINLIDLMACRSPRVMDKEYFAASKLHLCGRLSHF
ncbi:hypothetical protein, partial [Pseudomonas viridiflava]|uniref:hypothetical protein n=1 Tax=Pseudomonas viridiflava TaxID=33069 RepID=UPI0019D20AC2